MAIEMLPEDIRMTRVWGQQGQNVKKMCIADILNPAV